MSLHNRGGELNYFFHVCVRKRCSRMRAVSISIIGGGIGGLATAIALKKGFNVQVYERAQALRPAGAGLTLSPTV